MRLMTGEHGDYLMIGRLEEADDCTVTDLQYEVDKRRELSEKTGIEHSAECRAVARTMQMLVDAMPAQRVSTVGRYPKR